MSKLTVKKLILGGLQTNCYIAGNDDCGKCAVIDPAADADTILSKAKEMGYEIESIILTHSHFDHFEALEELYLKTDATVYVSSADKPGLIYPQLNLSAAFYGIPLTFEHPVTTVDEGDTINIGSSHLSVISTPGHTAGSVCYISHDDKLIFSGDTVFAGTIGRTDFPGGDYGTIINSLNRILTYDAEYSILSGHGDITDVATEKRCNPYYKR